MIYPQQVDLGVVRPGNSCQNHNLIHLLLQQHVQIVLPVNIRRPTMLTAVAPFVLQEKPKTNLQLLQRLVHFASRGSNLTLRLLHVPIAVPEDFKTKPTSHRWPAKFVLQEKSKTNLQLLPRLVNFASRVSNLTLRLLHVPIAVPEDFKTKPT
jgi:hypothetical protein